MDCITAYNPILGSIFMPLMDAKVQTDKNEHDAWNEFNQQQQMAHIFRCDNIEQPKNYSAATEYSWFQILKFDECKHCYWDLSSDSTRISSDLMKFKFITRVY